MNTLVRLLFIATFILSAKTLMAQSSGFNAPDSAIENQVKQTLKENAETLRFMENQGQLNNKAVLFYFQGKNGSSYIEHDKICFVANDYEAINNSVAKSGATQNQMLKGTHTFTLSLTGSNPNSKIELGESFATKYNYFLASNSKEGITGVRAAKDLTLKDIYPGIDLRLYSSTDGSLEFDWIMATGADYSQVKLHFKGQDDLSIDKDGNLKVRLRFTSVKFNIPESYQVTGLGKVPVNFSFNKTNENTVAFIANSNINSHYPIVIDPILSWGTYMDGNNSGFDDYLYAIQVDPTDGMVYCAGSTNRQIPTNAAPYDADGYLNIVNGLSGNNGITSYPNVAVIYRINASGNDLVDLTLFGPGTVSGATSDQVVAYALSLSPNRVFVGGFTNADIPKMGSPFDSIRSSSDGFVAAFSRDLGSLNYSTYLGGTGAESRGVTSIRTIDDNSFVVGMTAAAALPTSTPNYITTGAAQTTFGGSSDIYIAKFTNLRTLSWGTYVGGTTSSTFNDLEVLPDGRVAFCGYGTGQFSGSSGIPAEVNSAAGRSTGSDEDGILGVLNSTGTTFNYLDEIGGAGNDRINDVEIVGNTLYWTGAVASGFPTSTSAYHTSYYGGTTDVIVGSEDAGGGTSSYKATFYGTSGNDLGNGIRLVSQTSCGGASTIFLLVFGTVGASGLPTQNINNESFYNSSFTGGGNVGLDMFFAGFTSNLGSLTYGTYIGGNEDDYLGATGDPRGANHLWVNGANVYVGTTTHSTTHSPTILSNGFDLIRSNPDDDEHIIFSIQFASLLVSDYGDAPATYGTPAHILDCSHLRIGLLVDNESGNQPSLYADGDDTNGSDDEDGISTLPVLSAGASQNVSITVNNILNSTSNSANLYGWIDFNGDGQFSNNEFTSTIVTSGFTGSKTLTWTGVAIGGDASKHYLRIRLTTNNLADNIGTTALDERSTTQASDGEVEDYLCQELTCPTAQTEAPCQSQEAINAKYATWLASARAGGGCNGSLINNSTGAPNVNTGGTATVTFIYTSTCAPLSTSCTSSFSVTPVSTILVTPTIGTIACNGGSTTVHIAASGGTTPYSSIGDFTQSAGAHTYVVIDANGCGTSVDITITQPNVLSASESHSAIQCNGTSSTVTVAASGGTVPYTGTGSFSQNAGTHTYTVSDAHGCSTTVDVTITQPTLLSASESHTAIQCNSSSSMVTISASGGTAPYTGTGNFSQNASTHTYTVSDAHGCSTTIDATITQPNALSAFESHTVILCYGSSSTVTISASGGTVPYTGTGSFSQSAGTHTYIVSDANGCSTYIDATITQPSSALSASESHTAIQCHGGSSTVTISASGGTSPYTGTGDFSQNVGIHTYIVTDANGCSTIVDATVSQPDLLAASESHTSIPCHGSSSTVTISPSGGTAPYTGTGDFSQSAGTYAYTVTDANGCSNIVNATISEPDALGITGMAVNVSIPEGHDGSIDVTATGGTPPYNYIWNDGATTEDRNGLGRGAYTVTLTDHNGCQEQQSFTITQPCNIQINGTCKKPMCHDDSNGSINITVTGAQGQVTYLWNDGVTTEDRTGLAAGIYTVTASDEGGCSSTLTRPIIEPDAIVMSETHLNVSTFGGHDGSIDITVAGGSGKIKYMWNDHKKSQDRSGLIAGTYTVTATDGHGCSTSGAIVINQPQGKDGLNESGSATSIVLYPNPTSGAFKAHLDLGNFSNDQYIMRITNTLGQIISEQKGAVVDGIVDSNASFINYDSAGMYFVEIIVGGEVYTQRISFSGK